MSKQATIVVVGAVILLGIAVAASAGVFGGDDEGSGGKETMTMPGGETMPQEQMTETENGTMTMPNGETMPQQEMTETDGTMTMPNGETMPQKEMDRTETDK